MIVVDVETTGLSPKHNSIVSIGAVDFANPTDQFYIECQVEPGKEVSPRALEVNGFTMEQITDQTKPTLEEALKQWLDWATVKADRTLAGHNTSFDYGMLSYACRAAGLGWPFGIRVIDLHTLAYSHYISRGEQPPLYGGSSGISTDTVFEYVGLPREPKPHHGLMGAQLEAEAFARFIRGSALLTEFMKFPVPDYLKR
jgi:DNA polymerase III epsilon subunit-like protein